ncbi:hypothetical protein DSL72_005494 [Monilinia vaccinii-corymbosi]|uniref:Erythromycin biosynthesis protein CIII-like C-terminal domain-containing protein n=1 Tax=Monilinia vaccinii-corymbosi TaxID=61207 RepID=A0A8A3PFQ9_9HELO|nr:hypothetical protein DSL72_005494 [Monilinia vaccinii-corymbosi]
MTPVLLSSQDVPPLGSGLFPDNSPAGRERNKALNARFQNGTCAELTKCFNDNLEELGAQRPSTFFLDIPYILPDRFIQLCTPGVEYPRSDAPKKLLFTGGLPKAHGGFVSDTTRPAWWEEVTTNSSHKRIILHFPFANHDSTIVIAALGDKGASLPDSFPIPENTYVEDLIPFDDVLPYCDVFVTNGGYGAFQHGLSNGCPMVMGGDTEEKAENSMRCEWAGINLRSGRPGVENLRRGVEKVLADGKYRERAEEVRKEMEGSDSVGVFETLIQEVVREKRVNSLVG